MKPQLLRTLLAFSVLINVGVLGAAAYRELNTDAFPGLPRYLELDVTQTRHWHEAERNFLVQLADVTTAIEAHRSRMIRAIFAESPDLAQIDAERVAIAALHRPEHVQQQWLWMLQLYQRAVGRPMLS